MIGCFARDLKNKSHQLQVAALVYQASQPFYDLFTDDSTKIIIAIQGQFFMEHSELSDCWVLRQDGKVIGMHCAFPTKELPERQMISVKGLIENFGLTESLFNKISDYRSLVGPLNLTQGNYLSRIGVPKDLRSQGLGSELLRNFEKNHHGPYSLHVNQENVSAIQFYEQRGYCFVPGSNTFEVRVMTKPSKMK